MLLPILLALHAPFSMPGSMSALQGTPPSQATAPSTSETAEDIEILRRLLVEAIEPAAASGFVTSPTGDLSLGSLTATESILTFYQGNQRVARSRGFHLPGSGAFYSIDLELPAVLTASTEAQPDGDGARDDDWERTRSEVRAGGQPSVRKQLFYAVNDSGTSRRLVIDARARDAAVDAVLGTLAKHGARIRGLASHDAIVVALYTEGVAGNAWRTETGEEGGDFVQGSIPLLSSLIAQRSLSEHVVIQVPLEALRDGASVDEIRRAAQIHRY